MNIWTVTYRSNKGARTVVFLDRGEVSDFLVALPEGTLLDFAQHVIHEHPNNPPGWVQRLDATLPAPEAL